jgi:chromate reductase
VALMAAAAGRAGGARAAYALRLAMAPFRARISTGPEILVANCRKEFDEDGRLISERYQRNLATAMERLREEARG